MQLTEGLRERTEHLNIFLFSITSQCNGRGVVKISQQKPQILQT